MINKYLESLFIWLASGAIVVILDGDYLSYRGDIAMIIFALLMSFINDLYIKYTNESN